MKNSNSTSEISISSTLKWSLVGHVAVGLVVWINAWVFPDRSIPFVPTLKVDIVGLPDRLKKDVTLPSKARLSPQIAKILKEAEQDANRIQSNKEVAPPPAVEKAQKDEMVVKPKTQSVAKAKAPPPPSQEPEQKPNLAKRNQDALRRMKALAKISESMDADNSKSDTPAPPIRGNKISLGSSLTGSDTQSLQSSYLGMLRNQLEENFNPPLWLKRQNYVATALVKIDASGRINLLILEKPSGNSQFDDAVKRAVQKSQPFPTPPKELVATFLKDGIRLGFPL